MQSKYTYSTIRDAFIWKEKHLTCLKGINTDLNCQFFPESSVILRLSCKHIRVEPLEPIGSIVSMCIRLWVLSHMSTLQDQYTHQLHCIYSHRVQLQPTDLIICWVLPTIFEMNLLSFNVWCDQHSSQNRNTLQ